MIKGLRNILFMIAISLLACCHGGRDHGETGPTHWLGPAANGIYPETGLLKEWPSEGPGILWIYDSLGIGFSTAVIQNDRLFITGMIDSTGYLYKFNLEGQLIYRVPYGLEFTGSYPGTRGSPVIVGDRVYLESGRGKLVCFENEDGAVIWSKDMLLDFDGKNIFWGMNETPVVHGDVIYATPGGKEYNVVALNRFNGDLVWKCSGEGDVSAYCTPLLFDHYGRWILVTYTASHLLGIDASTGNLLWSEDRPTEWSVNCMTPIYDQGELYYGTGNGRGGGKLKLSEDGSRVSQVWENQLGDIRFESILWDGYVYESFDEIKELSWRCVEWTTGKEMFRSRELAAGVMICADGMLYCYTTRGDLALVRPDPAGFHIVSQTKVKQGSGVHIAVPSIYKGVLYVRHGNALIAYQVKDGKL
jgi:outer membrane protein assembly factor BamB